MGNRNERVHVRLTKEELEHLKKCSAKQGRRFKRGDGRVNFSDYLRQQLLAGSGYRNVALIRQLRELKYELRKIGTNVNQVARKVNSGLGTPQDVERMQGYLARIEQLFEELREEPGSVLQGRRMTDGDRRGKEDDGEGGSGAAGDKP